MTNITIPRAVAEQLYELYNNVSAADAHYKRCQSDNFRMHIKGVYQSKAIDDAFSALKDALDEKPAEAAPVSRSAETRRRSVLSRE